MQNTAARLLKLFLGHRRIGRAEKDHCLHELPDAGA